MAVMAHLRWAAASDPGMRRTKNEDRWYADPDRGIYAVIDGVGGHAAGERAAEVALEVIRERLERQTGSPEDRLREAIALANNEIYRLSRSKLEWNGMACVLTIALLEDNTVTVGHVGDSRLYLLRPGQIRKVTHDHSPVGEREDRGELSEEEAMRHARRNEIYRDVGSSERNPDDAGFIEVASFRMPANGALLLCSDGLTDLVSSAEIRAGVERYAPDYDTAIHALVDAANAAGGKDNITVVLVAGPDYPEPSDDAAILVGERSAVRLFSRRWVWLICGLLVGSILGLVSPVVWNRFVQAGPRFWTVGSPGIMAALNQAHAGDTVLIPQGRYKERVELREGVTLRPQLPGTVTLISPDGGPAVIARRIEAGTLEGVWIQGDLDAPLAIGIQIVDASPTISNVKITGANTGIEVRGASAPLIASSQIANNLGAGMVIAQGAKPRVENNLIAANGNGKPGPAKPGVEVHDAAPVLKDNGIVDNATEPIRVYGRAYQPADYEENFFGGLSAKEAIRLDDEAVVGRTPRSAADAPVGLPGSDERVRGTRADRGVRPTHETQP
jgi:serine/threonine protein phosphatase PrpC